jgi:hypothetical protein
MVNRVLSTVLVLALAYIVITSLPDIERYLKIREM